MAWVSITVPTEPRFEERLSSAFEDLGAVAVTLLDAEDQPIYEPAPGTTPLWKRITLQALFPEPIDEDGVVFALSALQPGLDLGRVRVERIADRDWERAWLDDFQPMHFGERLWIVPNALAPPDEALAPDAVLLRLDPGLAFGTGNHATTALCLAWLDGADLAGARVLDFGCGSGVLALAALRLGAAHVDAVDNDPQALDATRANAQANGLGERIDAIAAEAWSPPAGGYGVVVANILANTLVALAPRLCAALADGGRLALSGVLADQADAVTAAYAAQGVALTAQERDGWLLLAGQRVPPNAAHAAADPAAATS